MKIRKTFLEQMEIIQMNPSKDEKQPRLPFKNEADEKEYSVRGTPEIAAIYKQLKQISDDPKKVEQLRQLSYRRGVDRKTFDEIKRQVEDSEQPFLNKKMKETRVANLNQLRDDIDKVNEQFKKLKTDLTLKNLYKQSLRNILNKFFMIPGMKTPRRYLMLPMSYSNTLKDINDLNSAENKYEKMFKILKDQIVIEPEKIDSDIKDYLERSDYQFKDFKTEFYNNVCYTKNGAEIKITDELEKIKTLIPNISNKYKALEKAPTDKKELIQKEIKKLENFKIDYLNRVLSFNVEVGTGMGDQSVVVITWVPRLILTQSTGTPWTSCQHLITGSQNPSVMTGMQEGVFIAWLVGLKNVNDIRKPKARMLIKPFFPKVKGTKKEIVWWSSKIYSESGGNFTLFKKVVNSFLYQKQQKTVEKGGGVSREFALMSKKKNMYEKDSRNLYRIYPDDEQGYSTETQSFEKIMTSKKPRAELIFNAHDFEPKAYIAFLKQMPDKDFVKYNDTNPVLGLAMENNAPTIFNYVAERLKKFKLDSIKNCLLVTVEPETNQVLVKMYINLLNELYKVYEDSFIEVMPFELIYGILKDHQLINSFLKEPLGMDLIKKSTTKVLVFISNNPLVSNDIKKTVNIIINGKIETANRSDIIEIYYRLILNKNEELKKLAENKLVKAFDNSDDKITEDLEDLMTKVFDLSATYTVEQEIIHKYSQMTIDIIKKVLIKNPKAINKKDEDDTIRSFLEVIIENNDLDVIKDLYTIKVFSSFLNGIIKEKIEKAIDMVDGDIYKHLLGKIKTTDDLDFFAKIDKNILIIIIFYLSDDFNLPLQDLANDEDFKKNLFLIDIFLEYIEKNKNLIAFLNKQVDFTETFVQSHLNKKHFSNIDNLVKNINNPTLRRFVMFIIGFLKEEQQMEILTNITLFFVKGEDSPMLWYVDQIKKLIKNPKKVKTLINNFSFENFSIEIPRESSFSDIIELDNLPSLLAHAVGRTADINIDLFIKTFDLSMADLVEIVTKEIDFNDNEDVVTKYQKCMHTFFQYEEFRKILESKKIIYQNNFKDTVMNLVNQKKYITDDMIKEYDYFNFYVKTKNNIKQFRAMLADFDPDMNPVAVYNLMAIFFKDIKIKDIVYDAELKNIFNFLKRKEAEKVLKDLDIAYEKKDIDNIFA